MAPEDPLKPLKSAIPKVLFQELRGAGERVRQEIDVVYRPLAEQTGLSLQELLTYLLTEQIAELRREVGAAVAKGIAVHVFKHEVRDEDDRGMPGDEWKRNNDLDDDGA